MDHQLSEEQINQCQEAFQRADTNSDGFINAAQLKQAIRYIGLPSSQTPLTDQQIHQYIEDLDENQQGQIGFTEFLTIMSHQFRDIDVQMGSLEAFRFFDKTNSGKISRQQLKMVIMNMGMSGGSIGNGQYRGNPAPMMKESEAEELLTEIDQDIIDTRGMIDYELFLKRLFNNL